MSTAIWANTRALFWVIFGNRQGAETPGNKADSRFLPSGKCTFRVALLGSFWGTWGALGGVRLSVRFWARPFSSFLRKGSRGREPRDPPGRPRGRLGVETGAPGATFEVQMLKPHWFLALLDVLMLKHQPLPRGNHTEKVVLDPPHVVFL